MDINFPIDYTTSKFYKNEKVAFQDEKMIQEEKKISNERCLALKTQSRTGSKLDLMSDFQAIFVVCQIFHNFQLFTSKLFSVEI